MGATRREFAFLRALLKQIGLPYLYGGKGLPGPGWLGTADVEPYAGRDCSGAITAPLAEVGGPDLRASYNAQRMWNAWQPTELIRPGTVALYGPDGQGVDHVMASLWDGVLVGSHGGTSATRTLERAKQLGAGVGLVMTHLYRHDFLGWRRIPWIDAACT